MSAITFGSVCSGIEAASVAWEPLGWRAAWLAEIEPFPCAVLAHHYPNVPNLGDMNRIPHLLRNGEIPAPDVFCGGTPCQAFSVAGLRNSLDDARGNLSLKFCDIANEIDIQRGAAGFLPAVIFWENVPGVLTTKDNAFGCFLGQLAGEDCPLVPPGGKWSNAGAVLGPQRAIAWRILDAQYFGVAQRRRRVFVVASAREGFDPAAVLFEFEGVRRDSAPRRKAQEDLAGTVTSSLGRRGGQPDCGSTPGFLQPVSAVLRGGNTGGSIDVAACLTAKGQRIDFEVETFAVQPVAGTLTATYGEQSGQDLMDMSGGLQLAPIAFSSKDYGADCAVDLSPTLRAGGHSTSHPNAGVPPAIAFNARQDPDCWLERTGPLDTDGGTQAAAYENDGVPWRDAIGMPHWPEQVQCVTGEVTHTLKAEGFDASEDGTGRGQPIVTAFQTKGSNLDMGVISGTIGTNCDRASGSAPMAQVGMAVRRLTPRECERLQDFPDDYTLIPGKRVKNVRPEKLDHDYLKYLARGGVLTFEQCMSAAADGPRYKALGNSWAVSNVRWIGQRIDHALRSQIEKTTIRRSA